MGNAFTPGLLIAPRTAVTKTRKLPMGGHATVAVGDIVTNSQTVGMANHQGPLTLVRAAEILEVDNDRMAKHLTCQVGDIVQKDQLLGETSHLFGLVRNECRSPVNGFIEEISETNGFVAIREPATILEVQAYLSGTVTRVTKTDVDVSCTACVIQGILGLGGESSGEIMIVSEDEDITLENLTEKCEGKIIVGGRSIEKDAIDMARLCKVKGIVVASIEHSVLHDILGEYIGVAITGQENLGFTLIVTEGFGKLSMDKRTMELLKRHEGESASFNGSTQIRAGVVRPEVIIPILEYCETKDQGGSLAVAKELQIGTRIRIIRAPYFGELATVKELPEQPVAIATEAKVRVLKAELASGESVTIPRANVEIID